MWHRRSRNFYDRTSTTMRVQRRRVNDTSDLNRANHSRSLFSTRLSINLYCVTLDVILPHRLGALSCIPRDEICIYRTNGAIARIIDRANALNVVLMVPCTAFRYGRLVFDRIDGNTEAGRERTEDRRGKTEEENGGQRRGKRLSISDCKYISMFPV